MICNKFSLFICVLLIPFLSNGMSDEEMSDEMSDEKKLRARMVGLYSDRDQQDELSLKAKSAIANINEEFKILLSGAEPIARTGAERAAREGERIKKIQSIIENLQQLRTTIAEQLPQCCYLTQHHLVRIIQALIDKVDKKLKKIITKLPDIDFLESIKKIYKIKWAIFEQLSRLNPSASLFEQSVDSLATEVRAEREKDDKFHLPKLLAALTETSRPVMDKVDELTVEGVDTTALLGLLNKYTVPAEDVEPTVVSASASSAHSSASSSSASSSSDETEEDAPTTAEKPDDNQPIDAATLADYGLNVAGLVATGYPKVRDFVAEYQNSDLKSYETLLMTPLTDPTISGTLNLLFNFTNPILGTLSHAFNGLGSFGSAYHSILRGAKSLAVMNEVCTPEEFEDKVHEWIQLGLSKGTEYLKDKEFKKLCAKSEGLCKFFEKTAKPHLEKFKAAAQETKRATDKFLGFLKELGTLDMTIANATLDVATVTATMMFRSHRSQRRTSLP